MKRCVLILVVPGVLVGCNTSSSPSPALALPTPMAPQTVYTGAIIDSLAGTGTLTVTVGTSGSTVGGTWSTTFPGQKPSNRLVNGTLNGTSYSAIVSDCLETAADSCFPDCRQAFTGVLTSGSLSGTYAEVPGDTCTAHSGSVSANRQ